MRRIILISAAVVIALVVAGGLWFWNEMQKPLYAPGMVREGQNLRSPLDPPVQPASGDFWQVEEDIRLHYLASGKGTPVLVVHGGPGIPFTAPVPGLERLNDSLRFYYYDQRGCGLSTRPINRFTSSNTYENMQALDRTLGLGAQIADIERIRRILGEERLILVGHSFGGFLASLYAAEFPDRVRALVLVAPAELLLMPPESGGLFEQVKAELPIEARGEYDAFIKQYLDFGSLFGKSDADLAALNVRFAGYYRVAARNRGFEVSGDSDPSLFGGWMGHAMYVSMGMKHDYREPLRSVRAPALVLHGSQDLQTEAASKMYASLLPNARFQVIPGAGHFSFSDQPELFSNAVGEFLASLQ
jgi:proline iminopeptidase